MLTVQQPAPTSSACPIESRHSASWGLGGPRKGRALCRELEEWPARRELSERLHAILHGLSRRGGAESTPGKHSDSPPERVPQGV